MLGEIEKTDWPDVKPSRFALLALWIAQILYSLCDIISIMPLKMLCVPISAVFGLYHQKT